MGPMLRGPRGVHVLFWHLRFDPFNHVGAAAISGKNISPVTMEGRITKTRTCELMALEVEKGWWSNLVED